MWPKRRVLKSKQMDTLLTFLEKTREGKYAEVEKSSLPYSRIEEQREEAYYEDEYYYSVR